MSLTIREHMTIQLAAAPYRYLAVRESHARETLGYEAVRFHQVVAALLKRPDVEAEYPLEVRRLRRMAEKRREVRSARRLNPTRG